MSKNLLLITLAIPLLGLAQDGGPIRGPVAGFIYDRETRAIRSVTGVPGSSYLGGSILADVDAASISSDGASAIAVQQGRLVVVRGIRTASPAAQPLEGALAGADLFAWSRTSAAIYSSAGRQAQIVREIGTAPAVSEPLDLSGLPGTVTVMALAGDSLVVGTEGGGVYLVKRGQSTRLIAGSQSPSALAVVGEDLLFADRESGSIWRVNDFAGDASSSIFASGIDSPVGLHVNNGRVFASSAGGRQLRIYDLATKAEGAALELEFTPAAFDFVGEPSLLLVARGVAGEQPYYLLDASQNPAVFFVPAGREQ
jgi:hypothetical protein